jgi:outer membrane protease
LPSWINFSNVAEEWLNKSVFLKRNVNYIFTENLSRKTHLLSNPLYHAGQHDMIALDLCFSNQRLNQANHPGEFQFTFSFATNLLQ